MKIYPNCPIIKRSVEIGGLSKEELIYKMKEENILINELGQILLEDDSFKTSNKKFSLETIELTVSQLGLLKGARLSQIFERAKDLDLELCPLELGPYLRLDYLDQPEGEPSPKNQAPSGSITIASNVINEDDDFPKGFYLRRIDGQLWLRGYIASDDYIWNPDDHFIFIK